MAFVEPRKRWRLSAGAQREEGVPTASWPSAVGGRPAARCVEYEKFVISPSSKLDFAGLPSNNWSSLFCHYETCSPRCNAFSPFFQFIYDFPALQSKPISLVSFSICCSCPPSTCCSRPHAMAAAYTPRAVACSSLRPCVERRWGQSPCRSPKQAPPVATADSPCRAPRRLRGGSRGQSPRRGPEQALPAAAARGPRRGGRWRPRRTDADAQASEPTICQLVLEM